MSELIANTGANCANEPLILVANTRQNNDTVYPGVEAIVLRYSHSVYVRQHSVRQ